ncbi:MAG: hypothetical protein AMXMBFR58_36610 [Phycisphaerae bacterium]
MADRLSNLESAFKVILDEARRNPEFAARLEKALGAVTEPPRSTPGKRRAKSVLDPFQLYGEGDARLREGLSALNIEQLKDIVAEHGMDRSRLAMKWKDADRLVGLIVETVSNRARKGDAFRTSAAARIPTKSEPAGAASEPGLGSSPPQEQPSSERLRRGAVSVQEGGAAEPGEHEGGQG